MTYLLFYDITDNAARSKVVNLLIANGFERIQLSVFIGLEDLQDKKSIWNYMESLIEESDKIYMLKITKKSLKAMRFLGSLDLDLEYLSGEKRSLFI